MKGTGFDRSNDGYGQWSPEGESWFLGIGIDEYQEGQKFRRLHNAVKDVTDIGNLLSERYYIDKSEFLLNEKATRSAIINTLHQLAKVLTQKDKLLIYFSGHGYKEELDSILSFTFWVPVDAKPNDVSSIISNNTILEYLKTIKARHIFLISDSCYSGSFLDSKVIILENTADLEIAIGYESKKSRWGLFSANRDEVAADGSPGENSPFAAAIITVLSQHQDQFINGGLFVDKVVKQANRNAPSQHAVYNPINGCGDNNGQYVFWRRLTPLSLPNQPKNDQNDITHWNKANTGEVGLPLKQKYPPKETPKINLLPFPFYEVDRELEINIPYITKSILNAMEKSLRQCRDFLLKGVDLNLQGGRWAIRDFCVQKAHTTVDMLNELDSLNEELEKYPLGSETLFDRVSYLEGKFTNELHGSQFQFVSEVEQKELTHAFNSPLEEAAFQFQKCREIVLQAVDDDLGQKLGLKNRLSDISTQLQLLYLLLEKLVSATDTQDWISEALN